MGDEFEQLRDAADAFQTLGAGTGKEEHRVTALVLAVLLEMGADPNADTLRALKSTAESYFREHPDNHPFSGTRAEGADRLLRLLTEYREQQLDELDIKTTLKLDFAAMAELLINQVPEIRPGLPAVQPYYETNDRDAQTAIAAELRTAIVAQLEKVNRRSGVDGPANIEAWAEAATRAVLRAFGDTDPENALKHRMKK